MALDERRLSFLPTRLEGAYEVWFRGVHSDIGGGNTNRGLNDIALKWMMEKAKAAGLPIADPDIADLQPDPSAAPHFDVKLPLCVRVIGSLDRRHYSVSAVDGCTNPPDTCPVESEQDERRAIKLGNAVQVLPVAARERIDGLWATAEATAQELDFPIDAAKDPLISLFQGRIALVTNDAQFKQAQENVVRLVAAMIEGAKARDFHVMSEFFLTEALFNLPHLFPFTD
jgi:hypothetical protein